MSRTSDEEVGNIGSVDPEVGEDDAGLFVGVGHAGGAPLSSGEERGDSGVSGWHWPYCYWCSCSWPEVEKTTPTLSSFVATSIRSPQY